MTQNNFLIEASELLKSMDKQNLRIFDATIIFPQMYGPDETPPSALEIYEQGHVPGAAFFDHQLFSDPNGKYPFTRLPPQQLHKRIGNVGISPADQVVVYSADMLPCATRAWWLLKYAGVENVKLLNGGLKAWTEAGGNLETKASHYAATEFTGSVNHKMFADLPEVEAALEQADAEVTHTLYEQVYQQAHIPNSTNLPTGLLHTDDHKFKSTQELKNLLADQQQKSTVINYCGGGIAATVNAMAHLMIGNQNVSVYDGSMSEWTGEGKPVDSNSELAS